MSPAEWYNTSTSPAAKLTETQVVLRINKVQRFTRR